MTAIPVTSSGGLHISSLTIGQLYRVETSGGPWHPHGIADGSDDSYAFHLSVDGSTWSAGIGIGGGADSYAPPWASGRVNLDAHHVAIDWTATTPELYIRVADNVFGDNTGALEATVTLVGAYCPYGTQSQPGGPISQFITQGAIDAVLAGIPGAGWLALGLQTLIGMPLPTQQNCNAPPPAFPTFTDADWLFGTHIPAPGSIPKFFQAMQSVSWSYFCQCTPGPVGSPPPIAYPPPLVPTQPTNVPTLPGPIVCDPRDLCAVLDNLTRLVNTVLTQVAYTRHDVQLIQRQHVPFGYLVGAVHSGLSGDGELAVQGLIGVAAEATSIPAHLGLAAGTPEANLFLGRLDLGTAHGWVQSFRLTAGDSLWLPIEGAITRIGYTFAGGVVATIRELVREP